MVDFQDSVGQTPGRTSALSCWLLVLGSVAAVSYGFAAQWDYRVKPADERRPAAQVGQDEYGGEIWALAFSPSGKSLASATITGELWLKSLATDQSSRLYKGPALSARTVAFSPDGKVLALAGGGPAVTFWDTETGDELDALDVGGEQVRCVAFSPDGTMLATGEMAAHGNDAVVTIWDRAGRRKIAVLGGLGGSINVLAFSPDNSVLAAGDLTGVVKLWDAAAARELATYPPVPGSGRGIVALIFSPRGDRLATACNIDPVVRFWDAAGGGLRGTIRSSAPGLHSLSFSPDGTLLAMAQDGGSAAIWDVADGREVGTVRAPGGTFYASAFSGDGGLLATGGRDEAVRIWDVSKAFGVR